MPIVVKIALQLMKLASEPAFKELLVWVGRTYLRKHPSPALEELVDLIEKYSGVAQG